MCKVLTKDTPLPLHKAGDGGAAGHEREGSLMLTLALALKVAGRLRRASHDSARVVISCRQDGALPAAQSLVCSRTSPRPAL